MPCRPWREDRPLYKVPHTFPSSINTGGLSLYRECNTFSWSPWPKKFFCLKYFIAEIFCRRSDLFPYSRPDVDPTDDPYPPFRPSYTIASLWEFIFKSFLTTGSPNWYTEFCKIDVDRYIELYAELHTNNLPFAQGSKTKLAKMNWYLNSQVSVWSRVANTGWDHL